MDGFVLAGGRSSRMGVDKARIPYPNDQPMALEVAAALATVCTRVALVRRRRDGLPWPLEVITDEAGEDAHPLYGVAAALRAATTDLVLLAPCDVPHLTEEVLRTLIARAPSVAETDRRHPLVGVFPRSWADTALEAARQGFSAHRFVDGCAGVQVPARAVQNLNRWADVGRPGPVRALLDGLAWLDEPARQRVAVGEITRLAHRGVVDPEAVSYAPSLVPGEGT